jgi:hypothetical protein
VYIKIEEIIIITNTTNIEDNICVALSFITFPSVASAVVYQLSLSNLRSRKSLNILRERKLDETRCMNNGKIARKSMIAIKEIAYLNRASVASRWGKSLSAVQNFNAYSIVNIIPETSSK